MQTPMKDEIEALVTPDIISLTRRQDDELRSVSQSEQFTKFDSDGRRTEDDDTEERLRPARTRNGEETACSERVQRTPQQCYNSQQQSG